MQTSKFCLEEILGENLRKAHFDSCYLIHKGETLLASAQHTPGCSWPVILERRGELLVGKRQVSDPSEGSSEPSHSTSLRQQWKKKKATVKIVGYFASVLLSSSVYFFNYCSISCC